MNILYRQKIREIVNWLTIHKTFQFICAYSQHCFTNFRILHKVYLFTILIGCYQSQCKKCDIIHRFMNSKKNNCSHYETYLVSIFNLLLGVSCPALASLPTLTWSKRHHAQAFPAKTWPSTLKKKLNVSNKNLSILLWSVCPRSWLNPSLSNPSSNNTWLRGKNLSFYINNYLLRNLG